MATEKAIKLFNEFQKIPIYILAKLSGYDVVKHNYDDLLQEGYLALLTSCEKVDMSYDNHTQYTYLYTAVQQRIIRYIKKLNLYYQTNQSLEAPIHSLEEEEKDLTLNDVLVSEDIIDKESVEKIIPETLSIYRKSIKYGQNQIDDRCNRLEFILKKIAEGYNETEIASMLNISRQRVNEILRRFEDILRKKKYNQYYNIK